MRDIFRRSVHECEVRLSRDGCKPLIRLLLSGALIRSPRNVHVSLGISGKSRALGKAHVGKSITYKRNFISQCGVYVC
jgi:hypothetical protein